jgi:hypothetical protein
MKRSSLLKEWVNQWSTPGCPFYFKDSNVCQSNMIAYNVKILH